MRWILDFRVSFRALERSLKKEQKEMFFSRQNWKDQKEYFNFIKFLFSNPSKV